jgi:hypothetical protein
MQSNLGIRGFPSRPPQRLKHLHELIPEMFSVTVTNKKEEAVAE